jgi:hypothetical protein
MAKFQSPLLGYNNNVRHKNRVFHIQTEDSGVNHPHIITHLFMDGGRILKSVKQSYAEHVGVEGMSETVRGLMKEQHKAMFIALRDGQFDSLVDGGAAPAKSTTSLPPAASAPAPGPVTIAEPAKVASVPPPAAAAQPKAPVVAFVPPPDSGRELAAIPSAPTAVEADDAPATTRQAPEVAAVASTAKPGLMLDLDALEREDAEAPAPSLFLSSELPPPPKNLFAKEPGTGAYRAVEADTREREPSPTAAQPHPAGARAPANRQTEPRYAPARPAAIFGRTQRPPPQSIFSDELVSDKSLDEVILSYLAEDLEPPRRK